MGATFEGQPLTTEKNVPEKRTAVVVGAWRSAGFLPSCPLPMRVATTRPVFHNVLLLFPRPQTYAAPSSSDTSPS